MYNNISISNHDNLASFGFPLLGTGINLSNNGQLSSIGGLGALTGPLEGIPTVRDNPALQYLTGLDGITEVGGYIDIINNDVLKSLKALDAVTGISSSLSISGNAALQDLNLLTTIGGAFNLESNDILSTLGGAGGRMSSLSEISSYFYVYNNTLLGDLDLSLLTTIGGLADTTRDTGAPKVLTSVHSIQILENDKLLDIDGLVNLTSISSEITIQNNGDPTTLAGLMDSSIEIFGANIYVINNPDLAGFSSITLLIGTENVFEIDGNPSLQVLNDLVKLDIVSGILRIHDNDGMKGDAGDGSGPGFTGLMSHIDTTTRSIGTLSVRGNEGFTETDVSDYITTTGISVTTPDYSSDDNGQDIVYD